MKQLLTVVGAAVLGAACMCGPAQQPTDVELGDTALVVVVNPPVNDANSVSVTAPGSDRVGVAVAIGDSAPEQTDARGIAVLEHLDGGTASLRVGDGTVSLVVTSGELRELAVSSAGASAALMADVRYDFAGAAVVELDGGQSAAEVSAALNASNRIVFIRGGRYTGDVVLDGSDVTLFGEGAQGGQVTIEGNVQVSGSGNRIRGTRIEGNLTVNGSDFALTFSEVTGVVTVDGSGTVLLENTLCAAPTFTGSGITALGNRGMAPLPVPDGGC